MYLHKVGTNMEKKQKLTLTELKGILGKLQSYFCIISFEANKWLRRTRNEKKAAFIRVVLQSN